MSLTSVKKTLEGGGVVVGLIVLIFATFVFIGYFTAATLVLFVYVAVAIIIFYVIKTALDLIKYVVDLFKK